MSENSRSDEGQSVGKVAKANNGVLGREAQQRGNGMLLIAQQGIIVSLIVFVNASPEAGIETAST